MTNQSTPIFLTDEDRANIAEFQKVYESLPSLSDFIPRLEARKAHTRACMDRMKAFPAYPSLTTDERYLLLRSMSWDLSSPEAEDAPHFDRVIHFGDGEDHATTPPTYRKAQVLSLLGSVTVRYPRIWPRKEITYTFDSLPKFTQGYVHALLSDMLFMQPAVPLVRFDQINPATLLRIIKDCERALAMGNTRDAEHEINYGQAETRGCIFWMDRLNDEFEDPTFAKTFRPLIPHMTQKGQVIFELPLANRG